MTATLIVIAVGVWLHLLLTVSVVGRAGKAAAKLKAAAQAWAVQQATQQKVRADD